MTTQATPPTDAEQAQTLTTANAMLRVRVKELEELKDRYRVEAERLRALARAVVASAARDVNDTDAVVLVDAQALRALKEQIPAMPAGREG